MAYRFLLTLLILWAATASAQTHRWNVAEAGAIGDGAMDCTAIFQQQMDACGPADTASTGHSPYPPT
jgi:polygalacturonase